MAGVSYNATPLRWAGGLHVISFCVSFGFHPQFHTHRATEPFAKDFTLLSVSCQQKCQQLRSWLSKYPNVHYRTHVPVQALPRGTPGIQLLPTTYRRATAHGRSCSVGTCRHVDSALGLICTTTSSFAPAANLHATLCVTSYDTCLHHGLRSFSVHLPTQQFTTSQLLAAFPCAPPCLPHAAAVLTASACACDVAYALDMSCPRAKSAGAPLLVHADTPPNIQCLFLHSNSSSPRQPPYGRSYVAVQAARRPPRCRLTPLWRGQSHG